MSSDTFTVTSLPWSRNPWLRHHAKLSSLVGCCCGHWFCLWCSVVVILCATHSLLSEGRTGVLWALTGTHPCGALIQDDEYTRAPALAWRTWTQLWVEVLWCSAVEHHKKNTDGTKKQAVDTKQKTRSDKKHTRDKNGRDKKNNQANSPVCLFVFFVPCACVFPICVCVCVLSPDCHTCFCPVGVFCPASHLLLCFVPCRSFCPALTSPSPPLLTQNPGAAGLEPSSCTTH